MVAPFFEHDWFSENIPIWNNLLGYLRNAPSIRGIEIGSFEGRSACWLLQNIFTHPTSQLTCIDLFEHDGEFEDIVEKMQLKISPELDLEARFDENMAAIGAGNRVRKMKGKSREILRTLPLGSFDFIYIDGSHTTSDVLADAVLSFELLKENGILAFDDYRWNCFPDEPLRNPTKGIDAFLECYANEIVVFWKEYQVFLRKVPHAERCALQSRVLT